MYLDFIGRQGVSDMFCFLDAAGPVPSAQPLDRHDVLTGHLGARRRHLDGRGVARKHDTFVCGRDDRLSMTGAFCRMPACSSVLRLSSLVAALPAGEGASAGIVDLSYAQYTFCSKESLRGR